MVCYPFRHVLKYRSISHVLYEKELKDENKDDTFKTTNAFVHPVEIDL